MASGRIPTTANSPITAKGDLFTYSTAPARLAVGNDGEQIVADSSTSTGLRYQGNNASGKNAVINGDCVVAQRGTSALTLSATAQYPVDRFFAIGHSGATAQQITSISNTSFKNAVRVQRTAASTTTSDLSFTQTFETNTSIPFQGKTVTLSFYARAGANFSPTSGTLTSRVYTGTGTDQGGFGFSWTGTANPINQGNTLTTSWQRFTATGTISSSATQIQVFFFCTPTGTAGAADYFDITGVQLEQGSVATSFQTATGTIQGELAACQRYFNRFSSASNAYNNFSTGNVRQTGAGANSYFNFFFPVEMRIAPTAVTLANITSCRIQQGATDSTVTAGVFDGATTKNGTISAQATIATAGTGTLAANNSTAVTIDWSAEL